MFEPSELHVVTLYRVSAIKRLASSKGRVSV